MQHTHQQIVGFHVDDIIVSHKNAKLNQNQFFGKQIYMDASTVKLKPGKCQEFLGMVCYGSTPRSVHVIQKEHVLDLIKPFGE